ncbi:MAG: TIM barrel protein [Thermoleophilia bacterium]
MTLPPDIGLPSQVRPEFALAAVLELLAPHTSLVEIDSFGLHTVLSPRNRRDAVASGLRLTVHGPYGCDINPGSPDEALRRRTVALHRRHVEAAAEMGALLYVVHPDYVAPPGPRDAAVVAALQRTIADLEETQREVGVRIAIENMPGVGSSHFTGPGDLELGELGLVLDCGHAAISGTLDAFLDDPHASLAHVHLHSNGGPTDTDDPHLPLGEGVVDAAAVLAAARAAEALVILEHLDEPSALASIAYLEAQGLV